MMDASVKAGGMLAAALDRGEVEPITWVDVAVGDLVISVASDALKAPVDGVPGVRLPVSYAEVVTMCRERDWVTPTKAMADAMLAHARSPIGFVPLVRTAEDARKMTSVGFVMRFHEGIEDKIAGKAPSERGLVFGAWKLWILHPRLAERGAVNYGFWDLGARPPRPVQTPGAQHDAAHYDYSQLFQPVQRRARRAATGEEVDLLDVLQTHDKIPARFLDVYRRGALSFDSPYDEEDPSLLDVLAAAGVDVEAVEGWETRGKQGFAPEGILVHHTAGPKRGDAPSLSLCVKGRPDVPGPLCHIVLARSGKAHLVTANIANHAGLGAAEVLDLVRADEPVDDDARARRYRDSVSGNPFLYGIEVENSGVPGDVYPDAQIDALGRICAALCQHHGFSPNRIIHHRQWTSRKVDMSFRGCVRDLAAQHMDAGLVSFAVPFEPLDGEPLPETDPCLPWGPGER